MKLLALIFGIFTFLMLFLAVVVYFIPANEMDRWTNVFFSIGVAAIFGAFALFALFLSRRGTDKQTGQKVGHDVRSIVLLVTAPSIVFVLVVYMVVNWFIRVP